MMAKESFSKETLSRPKVESQILVFGDGRKVELGENIDRLFVHKLL